MTPSAIRLPAGAPFDRLVGVGGIGTGIFLAVEGDRTIGRTESRAARLLDVRDYCKLHTVAHHVATLLGAAPSGDSFRVTPVGVVGADRDGAKLTAEMAAAGMDVARVRVDPARSTLFSVCFQYPGGDGANLTTSDSAAAMLSEDDVERAADLLDERTVALAQPEVPLPRRKRFLEAAGDAGSLRVASFTSVELDDARATGLFGSVDLVAMNAHEAATIVGDGLEASEAGDFLRRLSAAFGAPGRTVKVVVSVGEHGAYAIEGDRWAHRPAPRVEVASTAGCGDALLAGVIVALAAGVHFLDEAAPPSVDDALGFGVLLASLNATSPHTIHPSATIEGLIGLAGRCGVRFEGRLADVLDAGDR